MAAKKNKTQKTKTVKPKKVKKDQVDTEFYEVEQIRSSELEGHTLLYEVKWENWAEKHNTKEAEPRLLCDKKLLEYAKRLVVSVPTNPDFDRELQYLGTENQGDFITLLDPLSIFASTTVFTGTVKFISWDSVNSKLMFLKYLRDHNQSYLLHCYKTVMEDELDVSQDKYSEQYRFRLETFPESPLIEFRFPMEGRSFFYPPPPLSNILFEPVDTTILQQKPIHFFPPKSSTLGFNEITPFLDDKYFENLPEGHVRNNQMTDIGGMNRLYYEDTPRFKTNLVLRQEIGRGWTMRVSDSVVENTPLLMMTGVIRDAREAHESLKTEGERVAFSSFVKIPGTRYCLDRRQYHDFSKYISHSCNPSCSVRLVESGNRVPDLVVYSTRELSVECDISLDFFQGFQESVNHYFATKRIPETSDGMLFSLYEDCVDFVQCQCGSIHCRQVLYVDRSLKNTEKKTSKIEKLGNLDPAFKFGGVEIVESDLIWRISNQKFEM